MAIIIKATGETVTVKPKHGDKFTLEELQNVVGGYIQIVPLVKRGEQLICNEEGLRLKLPVNATASEYCAGETFWGQDFLLGDILICSPDDLE